MVIGTAVERDNKRKIVGSQPVLGPRAILEKAIRSTKKIFLGFEFTKDILNLEMKDL